MADATRFRVETEEIERAAGWLVTSQTSSDQFTRQDVTIEVAYSAKDFVREITRHGPNGERVVVPSATVGKIDLLRFWLTGLKSNVIKASAKRAAGVDW